MPGNYAVIGAGQFGRAVALNLARQGHPVLVIDLDENRIQDISSEVDAAVVADSTDEATLRELELERMVSTVVAIGADALEASIMTTALLQQMGISRIIARAVNVLHARVLLSVGAHEVINPEEEMGKRLATRLVQPTIKEMFDLGSANLAEVEVAEQFVGRSLKDLDMRNRYGVTVMALRRDQEIIPNPPAAEKLLVGDVMIVLGSPDSVRRVASLV